MFNWLIVESNWLCGYLAQRSWVFLIFAFFNVCLFYEFGFLFHSFVCLVFYFIHFFVCCSCLCGYSRFLPFFNVCLFISSFFYFIHLFVCGLFVHSFVCLCIFNFSLFSTQIFWTGHFRREQDIQEVPSSTKELPALVMTDVGAGACSPGVPNFVHNR